MGVDHSVGQPRNKGQYGHKPRVSSGQLALSDLSASQRDELAAQCYDEAFDRLRQARSLPMFSEDRERLMGQVRGYCVGIEVFRGDSGVFQRMMNDEYRHVTKRAEGPLNCDDARDRLEGFSPPERSEARSRGCREAVEDVLSLMA